MKPEVGIHAAVKIVGLECGSPRFEARPHVRTEINSKCPAADGDRPTFQTVPDFPNLKDVFDRQRRHFGAPPRSDDYKPVGLETK